MVRAGLFSLLLTLTLLTSCRREERRTVERIGVLPFENLTGDPSLAWFGHAVQGIVRTEMTASLHATAILAPNRNDALGAGATAYLLGYYTLENGKLRLHAVQEDGTTHKQVRSLDVSGDPAAGALGVADAVAKRFGDRSRPFGSNNTAAVRAWGEALASSDPAARSSGFEKAVGLDPNFGEAYVALAEAKAVAGDREGLVSVIQRARARENLFTDLDRARVDLLSADMSGDQGSRRTALVALSRLTTTDPRTLEQLAEIEFRARRFQQAAEAYRNALALKPQDPAILNQLGYAEAMRGNLEAAQDALERYARVEPNSANPLDSLGDACFYNGQFGQAEKYYLQAWDKEKAAGGMDLLKAAQARLMTGDTAGADGLYSRYADFRRSTRDPMVDLELARWRYIEGRQKEAVATVERFAKTAPADYSAYAHAHLVVWYLIAGQTGLAQDHAAAAMQSAQSPGSRAIAAVSRFLAQPKSDPAGWALSANQLFGPADNPFKTNAVAYGLLLSRQFGPASQLFQTLYQGSSPGADSVPRALFAWTLVETSRKADAAPLVERYILPFGTTGEALFATIAFPRFLEVRAEALEAAGRNSEAKPSRDLYAKLKGDMPDIFARR